MVKILSAFNTFEKAKICVVGDLILDTYTFGAIRRISPEAPVSVMDAKSDEIRLGGAANVALNLKSLGMEVALLGCIGDDEMGETFLEALEAAGIDHSGIIREKGRPTSVKNRLIAGGQQVMRVDREVCTPISEATSKALQAHFNATMPSCSILLFSDYAKGLLTPGLLQRMIKASSVPVIVDPKGTDFSRYRGATLIKPNLKETLEAAGESDLEIAATSLLDVTGAERLLVTRASEGISIFSKTGRLNFPTRAKEVTDVTGAGDTVCATLACCMANGWSDTEMAELANVAASIAIEEIGCARVTLSKLAKRLLELHLTSKIFEEGHTFALRHVLAGHPFTWLALEECRDFSAALFKAIRSVKKQGEELVVYVDKEQASHELIDILKSLSEVDYILFKNRGFSALRSELEPAASYLFNGDSLDVLDALTS